MIEYVKGEIIELSPTNAVIETVGGVAYNLAITLPTYTELQNKTTAKLLVHENIREDAWVIYGFLDQKERELFRELIGVSGVGASTARIILSAIPAKQLEIVISQGEEKTLKSVKGVGQKTAQRIIVDLKGKIKLEEDSLENISPIANETYEEALTALTILGFQKNACQKVLKKVFDADSTIKVEKAIKEALKML